MGNDGEGRVLSVPYRTMTAAIVSLPKRLGAGQGYSSGPLTRMRQSWAAGGTSALPFQFVKIRPAIQLRWLDAQLRQNRHDLGAVFGRVVDRLGEKDRLWHITRGALPVDLYRVAGLHLGRPLDQARAARTHRFRHFRQGQWRRIFWDDDTADRC